jgi:signal transduction histidine kinase
METIKRLICVDYKIYHCILFQLISNAIKHCTPDSVIRVIFQFQMRVDSDHSNS